MIVAGGLYLETCEIPFWNERFGSGGRAAAVLSGLTPHVELHTYATSNVDAQKNFPDNVHLVCAPSEISIGFSYFHPLSRPVISPPKSSLLTYAPLQISGEAVLRFGFLEGDAIVSAQRAVYDPQARQNLASFRANGSTANTLAVVLNESELCSLGESSDIKQAVLNILERDEADVVVLKRGVHGAAVFSADGSVNIIPSYLSNRVFKIGTGDVFSAIFSFYWAEVMRSAVDAADLASRAVAAYAENGKLPLALAEGARSIPVKMEHIGKVLLYGPCKTIQDRWLLEEAQWCIRDLGVDVDCPPLSKNKKRADDFSTAVMILGDDNEFFKQPEIVDVLRGSLPVLIFRHSELPNFIRGNPNVTHKQDFSSSIYAACWLSFCSSNSTQIYS